MNVMRMIGGALLALLVLILVLIWKGSGLRSDLELLKKPLGQQAIDLQTVKVETDAVKLAVYGTKGNKFAPGVIGRLAKAERLVSFSATAQGLRRLADTVDAHSRQIAHLNTTVDNLKTAVENITFGEFAQLEVLLREDWRRARTVKAGGWVITTSFNADKRRCLEITIPTGTLVDADLEKVLEPFGLSFVDPDLWKEKGLDWDPKTELKAKILDAKRAGNTSMTLAVGPRQPSYPSPAVASATLLAQWRQPEQPAESEAFKVLKGQVAAFKAQLAKLEEEPSDSGAQASASTTAAVQPEVKTTETAAVSDATSAGLKNRLEWFREHGSPRDYANYPWTKGEGANVSQPGSQDDIEFVHDAE